jgi:hypothetical protein
MSTPNINITAQNIQGSCDLKCAYNFTYTETNLTATNEGVMISLTPDNTSISPVTYNTQKYNVNKITIVSPSIHIFNGATTNSEIIIEHSPVMGGNLLSVAIPIVSSGETTNATNFINDIIQGVATNAPAQSETTTLNIDGFTLQQIVPNKPFYSYTNETTDWIVFGIAFAIPLSSSTLATLSQIIQPFPLPTQGESLFFNKSGPNSSDTGSGDIYISCNPTGSSEEETPVEYTKNTPSYDLYNMLSSPIFKTVLQVIIVSIIFIIVFLMFNYLYTYITTSSSTFKLPSIIQKQIIKTNT